MTGAIFRAALLGLLRDRGALVMSFVVPLVFFAIFAQIFASAAEEQLHLRVAIVDEVGDEDSTRLLAAIAADPAIIRLPGSFDREQVRVLVRRGTADVGLVVRADGESLASAAGLAAPPLLLLVDPSRNVTAAVLAGQLQQAYFSALPDLAIGRVAELIGTEFTTFTPEQADEIAAGLAGVRESAVRGAAAGWDFSTLLERQAVAGQTAALNHVAYYAGAIAIMFLLFSAAQSALGLLDDKEAGLLDRVAAGPGGIGVVVNGRFLWLLCQGMVQTAVIFGAAWLVYGVNLPANLGPWLVIALCAVTAAAGVGLTLVLVCRSRTQAQILPTAVILIVSAMGGSMVPRFFMPGWLQDAGWLTPNTWALEAWSGVFWQGEPLLAVLPLCGLLLGLGLLGLGASHILARGLVRD